jgi:hypothetical protein
LRRGFYREYGPKRDEVTGEWRNLRSEELRNLFSSPHIVREVKSRRMGWAEHMVHVGEKSVQSFGGKGRIKETARKTEA